MRCPDIQLYRVDSFADYDELIAWLVPVLDSGQPISLDLETAGFDARGYGRGFTRLFQVGTATEGWAVDARDHHGFCKHVATLVANAHGPVVYANEKFEAHAFDVEGWPSPAWHRRQDVVAMHRLVRSEQQQHGLKPACGAEFGSWAVAGQDGLKRMFDEHGYTWDTIPTDTPEYWAYGVIDTCLTVLLYNKLLPEVPWFYEVEQGYQRITYEWEKRGIELDPAAVEFAHGVWTEKIDELREPLKDLGFAKPSSSTAVREAFIALGHTPSHFSEVSGDPTYNKMVLTLLQSYGGQVGKAAEMLMAFRSATAWRNNYGRKLLGFMDEDNLIHPKFLTSQARTGRSSVVEPPLQTIPHGEITRNMFVARKGMVFYAVDYLSQEIREMAGMSGDKALCAFFADPDGGDYHQYVADVAGIPRDTAKTISYARPYGAGDSTMARTAGCSVEAMQGYLGQLDAKFPDVARWLTENTRKAEELSRTNGWPYVDLPYGRRSALHLGSEHTQASNTLIQGHGADVLKLAACRLDAAGLCEYMVMSVHDEILFEMPDDPSSLLLAQEAAEIMEDNKLPVPLTCDVTGPLARWGEAYKKEAA